MADTPAWFDEGFYLRSKLNQLQLDDSTTEWDMDSLVAAIDDAGLTPFSHFQSYSLEEGTSPNPFFNAHEYLHAKLRQLEKEEPGQYGSIQEVADAIDNAGMNLWEHFQTYGWKEGVNPSNSFDIDGYFESKLEELQRTDAEGDWDMQKVKDTFADVGLDPISHYERYGQDEEVTPVEVPVEDQVDPDPNPVDPEPGPDPTFTATNTDGTITFAGDATGEIWLNGDGDNISFERQGVSDAWDDATLQDVQRIALEDDSPFTFKEVNLSYPQFPDESAGGSPRLWLDYTSNVATASLKLDGVIDKAAIGVTGENLTELNISGGFANSPDTEWHQLQLWDGAPSGSTGLPALETITLTMTSDTDVAAYSPLGVLTQPTKLDGSASTGALKITPAGAPVDKLGWAEVSTGSGNDVLAFDGGQVKEWLSINAGAGDDSIEFGINTTVSGGEGNDTFIITAPAGTGNPTEQMFITDYSAGDTIDLTQVEDLHLNGSDGDRLEVHQGGQTGEGWGSTPQGTLNDVLIQLSGGSGSQLIVEGAHAAGTTIALKVTGEQAGLGSPSDVMDFLVNITEEGEIDATTYTEGALLSGGGGSQTLISGEGNDVMQGGAGADTFVFNQGFGQDTILDFDQGENDKIDFSAFEAAKNDVTSNQVDGDTIFTIDGNNLIVVGATLDTNDLHFGA